MREFRKTEDNKKLKWWQKLWRIIDVRGAGNDTGAGHHERMQARRRKSRFDIYK